MEWPRLARNPNRDVAAANAGRPAAGFRSYHQSDGGFAAGAGGQRGQPPVTPNTLPRWRLVMGQRLAQLGKGMVARPLGRPAQFPG